MSMGTRKACLPLQSWASASCRGWCQGHTSAWSKNGGPGKVPLQLYLWCISRMAWFWPFLKIELPRVEIFSFHFSFPTSIRPSPRFIWCLSILSSTSNLTSQIISASECFFFIKPLVNDSPRSVDFFTPPTPQVNTLCGARSNYWVELSAESRPERRFWKGKVSSTSFESELKSEEFKCVWLITQVCPWFWLLFARRNIRKWCWIQCV